MFTLQTTAPLFVVSAQLPTALDTNFSVSAIQFPNLLSVQSPITLMPGQECFVAAICIEGEVNFSKLIDLNKKCPS